MGLSIWQLKRQLAFLAAAAQWADTPNGLVFSGGAVVSEDLEGNFRLGSVTIDGPAALGGKDNAGGLAPFCRVQLLNAEWDRASSLPRMERALLRMHATAGGGAVPGTPSQSGFDSHGINQVTGALRDPVQGQGKSRGRDADELVGRFVEQYSRFVDTVHGFQGRVRAADTMRHVNGSMVLKRALDVEVFNPSPQNYYHPARGMRATGAAGTVTLSWLAPPLRYDSAPGVLRRGTNSGDPAPASPTSGGTLINGAVAVGATGATDSPGAGTWNYSYWPGYAETPTAVVDRYPIASMAGAAA